MKTNTIVPFFTIVFFASTIFAKTTITKSLQGFRGGDTINIRQVEFKDPGRSGTDVLWDFSKLKSINDNYNICYYTPVLKKRGDSTCITCLQHRTMYKYVSKGNSLLLMGFENAGSRLTFECPQYVMHFPFTFGDSISSTFKGAGSHEHSVSTKTEGLLSVVADAMGTLILPDGDTLYNALRVRTLHTYKQRAEPILNERQKRIKIGKDSLIFDERAKKNLIMASDSSCTSTENRSVAESGQEILKNVFGKAEKGKYEKFTTGQDSIFFRTETYRWYAPGYRYPLFETIRNYSRAPSDTVEKDDISTAFCFPPSLHAYLKDDPQNKAILDSLLVLRDRVQNNPSDTLLFDYNLYPIPVRSELNVELLLDLPSKVRMVICAMTGNPELSKDFGFFNAGEQTLIQNLSQLDVGYHVLHIQVNEQAVQIVFLKN